VHYYDGRYTVPGNFGDPGSLYDAERLTWYQEGWPSTWYVGSTRAARCVAPANDVDRVKSPATGRSDLSGGHHQRLVQLRLQFYRYAAISWAAWARERPDD